MRVLCFCVTVALMGLASTGQADQYGVKKTYRRLLTQWKKDNNGVAPRAERRFLLEMAIMAKATGARLYRSKETGSPNFVVDDGHTKRVILTTRFSHQVEPFYGVAMSTVTPRVERVRIGDVVMLTERFTAGTKPLPLVAKAGLAGKVKPGDPVTYITATKKNKVISRQIAVGEGKQEVQYDITDLEL